MNKTNDLDYEKVSDEIEHIDLSNLDTENLNSSLLKGKFVALEKLPKCKARLNYLNKVKGFLLNQKDFLKNCLWFDDSRIKAIMIEIDKQIKELDENMEICQDEVKRLGGVVNV